MINKVKKISVCFLLGICFVVNSYSQENMPSSKSIKDVAQKCEKKDESMQEKDNKTSLSQKLNDIVEKYGPALTVATASSSLMANVVAYKRTEQGYDILLEQLRESNKRVMRMYLLGVAVGMVPYILLVIISRL